MTGLLSDDLKSSAVAWPTPKASDGAKGGPNQKYGRGDAPLPAVTAQWPTPHAYSFVDSHAPGQVKLDHAVRAWETPIPCPCPSSPPAPPSATPGAASSPSTPASPPPSPGPAQWATPQAHDAAGGSPERVGRFGTTHGGRNLADDVTAWPTPDTNPEAPNLGSNRAPGTTQSLGLLAEDVMLEATPEPLWLTPGTSYMGVPLAALSAKDGGPPEANHRIYRETKVGERIHVTPDLALQVAVLAGERRRLNPAFVEWLMGFPPNWTVPASAGPGCIPSEMQWFHYRARLRLLTLCGSSASI